MGKKKRQCDPNIDEVSNSTDDENESNTNQGGSVTQSQTNCTHIKKSVTPQKYRKQFKSPETNSNCSECNKIVLTIKEEDTENLNNNNDQSLWVCLYCGVLLCEKNQHTIKHFKTPRSEAHTIQINKSTYKVRCLECNIDINSNAHKKISECIEMIKKKNEMNDTEAANVNQPIFHLQEYSNNNGDFKKASSSSGSSSSNQVSQLPRVRGLTNLGNTCFFNAVLQCLAQTPYLTQILSEVAKSGEEFELRGGVIVINDTEVLLPPIKGKLDSGGPLTTVLTDALDELQKSGSVFTPRKLLDSFASKWPQFAGGHQHDSHELLRHLLESVRSDDLRRYQAVILHHLGYSTRTHPAQVDCEMKRKIRFYGFQTIDDILVRPDQIFRGFLVSILTCQECNHTSSRHEHVLDISLPISVEKSQPPGRRRSAETVREDKIKRNSKNIKKKEQNNSEKVENEAKLNGSKSNSEQSDADDEDNLTDEQNKTITTQLQTCNLDSSTTNPEKIDDVPEIRNKDEIDVNNSITPVTSYGEYTSNSSKFQKVVEKFGTKLKQNPKQEHSKPFAPRYQCDEGECSIQSCLNTFTAIELLTGNDKVGCDNCTLQKNGKDGRTVYTQASKQFMISSPPAVLILHLKRFQVEARYMYRKITKFVSFPMVLDIAPFCSSNISRLENIKPNQTKILYSLYGIVEHSGSMHCGHYIAYVKVRSQVSVNDKERWSFLSKFSKTNLINTFDPKLDNDNGIINDGVNDNYDSDDSSSKNEPLGAEGGSNDPIIQPPPGKWYYVSDSHVREVTEDEVSKAQAYLLFYERIY